MERIQIQVNQIVQRFSMQVTELARHAALQALQATFEKPVRSRTWRGIRRSSADLDLLASRLVAFIEAHPGLRIEQINKQLGAKAGELALPIRKLIADRTIRAEGRKRSTTYFVER
jgi:hypothetical protein